MIRSHAQHESMNALNAQAHARVRTHADARSRLPIVLFASHARVACVRSLSSNASATRSKKYNRNKSKAKRSTGSKTIFK